MKGPDTRLTRANVRGLGMTALAFGFLGLALFWFIPLGILISAAGLLLGIIGWLLAPGRPEPALRWVHLGTALSALAFIVGLIVYLGGLGRWLSQGNY